MKKNQPAIRFEKEYLDELIKEENACVEIKEQNYHLALHPFHLTNINESIKDILNKGIARYDKKLDGILLGYQNIKLLSQAGTVAYDSFFIHIDIVASFYLFEPQVGKVLHGIVNKKSEDHVGCLVHKTFNVSLPKPADDDDWLGLQAEIGNEILLRITFIDLDARLPYIRAEFVSILSESDSGFNTSEEHAANKEQLKPKKIIFESDDESKVEEEEKKKKKKGKHKIDMKLEDEESEEKIDKKKRKHSSDNEDEIDFSHKKKTSKHKGDTSVDLNATNIEDDEQISKKKKKKKNKIKEELHDEEINTSLDGEKRKRRKSIKSEIKVENMSWEDNPDASLEEITNAVLRRTMLDFSEDVREEKKKVKKPKKIKVDMGEGDDLNATLPELNLDSLFENNQKVKLNASDNFVMADNEDKKVKKRRPSTFMNNVDSKADLFIDPELEKLLEDLDKNIKKENLTMKRRRSTSSDEFETHSKKKKRKIS